jgi:hypothetical protein
MAMNTQDTQFATALNCIDGRVQLPVNEAVRSEFGVPFVDTITEAGIVRFLSDHTDSPETESILSRIRVSLDCHGSRAIAVAAHSDCAGNPRSDEEQIGQLAQAVRFLQTHFPACTITALWVDLDRPAEVVVCASSEGPQEPRRVRG